MSETGWKPEVVHELFSCMMTKVLKETCKELFKEYTNNLEQVNPTQFWNNIISRDFIERIEICTKIDDNFDIDKEYKQKLSEVKNRIEDIIKEIKNNDKYVIISIPFDIKTFHDKSWDTPIDRFICFFTINYYII
jgi:ABC-type Fe3+-citrate transport system substrate-binding protein